MTYDLVIKNGTVIDPAQGIHAKKDIAVAGGRIAAIEDYVSDGDTHDVIEAVGLLVTPGLVDLHVHVWWGVAHLAIEADPACVYRGVTTAIDAGSSGANTVAGFHRYVMDEAYTRVLASCTYREWVSSTTILESLRTSGGLGSKRQWKLQNCTQM